MTGHEHELATWIRGHALEDVWAPFRHTTTAWIASASPPWATEEHRALACMDLGTCFFALDDAPGDDALARYDDLERLTTGAKPNPSRPLQAAFASLFDRIGAGEHYLLQRRDFARALRRRHALRAGERLEVDDYIALREVTIYFGAWLALWELAGDFVLAPPARAKVAAAFTPANRWQALENERFSVARDASSGTPNVIALVAASGCSLVEAAAIVGTRAESDLAAARCALAVLRTGDLDAASARYLDTLEHGVDGAIRHYRREDPARYL